MAAFDEPRKVDRASAMLAETFAGLTSWETADLRCLLRRFLASLMALACEEE